MGPESIDFERKWGERWPGGLGARTPVGRASGSRLKPPTGGDWAILTNDRGETRYRGSGSLRDVKTFGL